MPMHVHEKFNNSYIFKTLEGLMLQGQTHAHWLCQFIPRCDSDLARLQGEMADKGGQDSLGPELRATLADEIAGDGDEAAGSESDDDDDDGTESGPEEEELPNAMDHMLDGPVEIHWPAEHMRTHVPIRGVPAPGNPGERETRVRLRRLRLKKEILRRSTQLCYKTM